MLIKYINQNTVTNKKRRNKNSKNQEYITYSCKRVWSNTANSPSSKMQPNKVHQRKYPLVIKANYLARNFHFHVSWWSGQTDLLECQLTRWSPKNKEHTKQTQLRTLKHHMPSRHKNISRNRTHLPTSHEAQIIFQLPKVWCKKNNNPHQGYLPNNWHYTRNRNSR